MYMALSTLKCRYTLIYTDMCIKYRELTKERSWQVGVQSNSVISIELGFYIMCSQQHVFCIVFALNSMCSRQNVFSINCVLCRMCSLQNVFSIECVLYQMCSQQHVFYTECVLSIECVLSKECVSLLNVFSTKNRQDPADRRANVSGHVPAIIECVLYIDKTWQIGEQTYLVTCLLQFKPQRSISSESSSQLQFCKAYLTINIRPN